MVIDLRFVRSIPEAVAQLSPLFSQKKGAFIVVTLNFRTTMLYPEYLLLIVSAFHWAKENGIRVAITSVAENEPNYYPARINFYKLIGYNYKEPFFNRWSNKGRFIEITPLVFDNTNDITISSKVVDDIIRIVRDNYKITETLYKSINYCLWEQIDNIQVHSGCKGTGYVVAQNYPNKNEIRVCVVDTGIGIYESLTRSSSQYSGLLYKEAIEKCIEEHVTNGSGMGNGLYHSAQFIKENKGDFILYSGKYYIDIKNGVIQSVKKGALWQGTIIYQRINTNTPVDYNKVFNNCDVPTSVLECDDILDSLWHQ